MRSLIIGMAAAALLLSACAALQPAPPPVVSSGNEAADINKFCDEWLPTAAGVASMLELTGYVPPSYKAKADTFFSDAHIYVCDLNPRPQTYKDAGWAALMRRVSELAPAPK